VTISAERRAVAKRTVQFERYGGASLVGRGFRNNYAPKHCGVFGERRNQKPARPAFAPFPALLSMQQLSVRWQWFFVIAYWDQTFHFGRYEYRALLI